MSVIKALVSLVAMSGCMISVGDMKVDDTGSAYSPEPESKADYILLPDTLAAGASAEVILTSTPPQRWSAVVAIDVMGPMEVEMFSAEDNGLILKVSAPQDAEAGPVHIVLEFEDGTFDIARDAIEVVGIESSVGDTGTIIDEPGE
jgi:hypothetical protein